MQNNWRCGSEWVNVQEEVVTAEFVAARAAAGFDGFTLNFIVASRALAQRQRSGHLRCMPVD